MPLKYALAVTAASQRELFHVPAAPAARNPAFLAAPQPSLVAPVAPGGNALPEFAIDAFAMEQALQSAMPIDALATGLEATDFVEDDGSSSWFGWGSIAAAAVAGTVIIRTASTQNDRPTVADELNQELVAHELRAVAAADNKLATLAVMGKKEAKDFDGVAYAKELPGVTEPLGFWDPLGFCEAEDLTEGKLKFYRECELKHGRLGMLAALGFVVGENFHPLFGGNIDAPAYLAFQQTPLETFWPIVVIAIAIPEIYSVFTFETVGANDSRGKPTPQGQTWAIRADHESGDLGFDPLGLKPTDAAELKEMQTKELNNGRLAMIAAAGMVVQELATGNKLF
jgi:hypothetical protein